MATEQSVQAVEQIIGYKFRVRRCLLLQALTAAGAVAGDWDGNRRLAQLGAALTEFLFTYLAYEADAARDHTSNFRCSLSSNEQRAAVAKRTGIDNCIRYSERGGAGATSVLAKAVNAIIGAVYLDCGKDMSVILGVMLRLGIFLPSDQTVDPTMLSHNEVPTYSNVAFFAKALLHPQANASSFTALDEPARIPNALPLTQPVEEGSNVRAAQIADRLETEFRHDLSSTLMNRSTCGEDLSFDSILNYSRSGNTRGMDEIRGSPERQSGDVDSASQTQTQSLTKRKAPPLRSVVGKRRTLNGSDLIMDDNLALYLCEETERCKNYGCLPPDESFFTPAAKLAIRVWGEAEADTLAKISVYIASSHSIAMLQEMLQRRGEQRNLPVSCLAIQLSTTERFKLIRTLDKHIAFAQLIRRYHVLELFKDCGGPVTPAGSGFVLATQSDFEKSQRRPGNPMNLAEAEVTTNMLQDMYPDIDSSSEDYRAMYRIATDLRKLGQRLYVLETTFAGRGILGFMLGPGVTGSSGVGISDNMLLSVSDAVFSKFVSLLDTFQGDVLRDFSTAVSTMIDALVLGTPHHREKFNIESVRPSEIMGYPKGSTELLSLLR